MHAPRIVAKTVVLDDKNNVLILRRSETDTVRPGGADFPGGRIDEGETYKQAAIREIEEEVGIVVEPSEINLAYTTTNYYEDTSHIRFLFVTKLSSRPEVKLSHEHDKYEWLDVKAAVERFDHPVWGKALEYLSANKLLPA